MKTISGWFPFRVKVSYRDPSERAEWEKRNFPKASHHEWEDLPVDKTAEAIVFVRPDSTEWGELQKMAVAAAVKTIVGDIGWDNTDWCASVLSVDAIQCTAITAEPE